MPISVFTYYQRYLEWYNSVYPVEQHPVMLQGFKPLDFKTWLFNDFDKLTFYFTHLF